MSEPRTYALGHVLRFTVRGMLALDAILLAGFSVWFVGMFLWRVMQWLYRWLFAHPW